MDKRRYLVFALAMSGLCVLSGQPAQRNALSRFTIGVFLQDPGSILNGQTNARNYKDLGVNTFVGLWNWPSEKDMYPGYAVDAMKALKDAGLYAYAGNDQASIDWIRAHPEFDDTLVGYMLGDEPEMNKVNGNPADQPDNWNKLGKSIRAADPTRAIYGNFGKGFALDPWIGYHIDPGSTKEKDFAKYVEPLSVISTDLYGITDPWEQPFSHGVWVYGRCVTNVLRYAAGRPVWGVLEASAPWGEKEGHPEANQMYKRMQPELVMPIVWNMVVHGAQGIGYFCHDFSSTPSYFGALLEPGIPAAMKAADFSVLAYEKALMSASVDGTTAVASPATVPVTTLTKRVDGYTYVFAMGDGNEAHRLGSAVDATITVSGQKGTKSVDVLSDSRKISMTNGIIKDHFGPYELHVYRFAD